VGGVVVSKPVKDEIQRLLVKKNPIRQLARVIQTVGEFTINLSNTGVTAAFVSENGALGEGNPTLNKVNFSAYKIALMVKLSNELNTDSIDTMESYIAEIMADAIHDVETDAFLNGTGTGQPQGIVTGVTNTTAQATTQSGLANVYTKVNAQYRENGSWLFAEDVYLKLMAMPEFIESMRSNVLFGKPVYIGYKLPNGKLIFGDFSKGYLIVDRDQMPIRKSETRFMEQDVTVLTANKRTDGRVVDGNALVVATMS
jgi:HK97 family phage major capsid protein